MNKHNPDLLSYRRWAGILGGLIFVAFAGLFYFDVSAKTDDTEKRANRNFNDLSSTQPGNVRELGPCQNGNCVRNGKIAFQRNGEIYTINPDGTDLINITNSPTASYAGPNWSPDGRRIAFTTNRDGNNEIYSMNGDGSDLTRLTNNTASDFLPYYSPDGLTIVFGSDRDGNSEIYKMNADGSNQVRLTNDAGRQDYPAFSPDGQKIVYISGAQNSSPPLMLFTMNADGSNQQVIPGNNLPGQVYVRPSYSADGTKIIFTYTPGFFPPMNGTLQTYTMNADGTNIQFSNGRLGSYSPDGTKIVYTSIDGSQPHFLFTANADRSSPQSFVGDSSPIVAIDWQPIPVTRPAFDFDGDGRSDISVFRLAGGVWHLLRSQAGYSSLQWGLSTDVLTPADYDGDLKTDVAVWRPSDGNFYILNSFNSTVRIENFGLSGDVPTGGDWDGDGKADLSVYRGGAQATFYYRGSLGNPQGNVSFIPWGISGDKAVAGDYDGDGRTDAAIFRPANGTWYIRQSSNGQLSATNFGLANDVLVPADYDADGKTDLAVYRGGIWYLLRSTQGFAAFQFGLSADAPAPADYDGDGRADAAIYRNGVWWILNSQSGSVNAISFGLGSDAPVPSAFVR